MAPITWTNVTDHASELSVVSAAAQTDILAVANTTFNPAEFVDETSVKLKLARIYYAAHFGTLEKEKSGGAAAGTVIAESAGGLSRNYASAASIVSSSGFDQTPYGRLLIVLIRSLPSRAPRTI